MDTNKFLIKAHKALDATTVENGIGNDALCMLHLVYLYGLLIRFIETEKPKAPKEGIS